MIAATGLAAAYGERIIFEDVSFRLGAGQLGLLCGSNGAGKTTLLRILAGLARPLRGQARPGEGALGIAWAGHMPAIYPDLTVLENLLFWKAAGGMGTARPEVWLERFGLEAFVHERARTLSRGLTQRLALARTFMAEAPVLLLDEPGAGLDRRGKKSLLEALSHSLERGTCALLVTHDPAVFSELGPVGYRLGRHGLQPFGERESARARGQGMSLCCA